MADGNGDREILRLTGEYEAAMHAMQSAVAMKMQLGDDAAKDTQPKSLRVGLNSAMITDHAVANLLIAKGLITKLEYVTAVRDAAVTELESYKIWFRARGLPVDFA